MAKYHQLSDSTMDYMLESLETLLDDVGDPSNEVEYSVSRTSQFLFDNANPSAEWSLNIGIGGAWDICD